MVENTKQPNPLESDPAHILIGKFFHKYLPEIKGGTVLELGSRARSGNSRKDLIPKHLDYVGFDIIQGPNVDVVGDAHKLSSYFEEGSVSAVFSMSVFEHIAMPWKVAIEINKVMKHGGIMMHNSHHAWPLHEEPWDYWRFNNETWKTLFNKKTGFEMVEAEMGEVGHLHPNYIHPVVDGIQGFPMYMLAVGICKKTSNTKLQWDVDIDDITEEMYPN